MNDPGPRIRELLLRARNLEQEVEALRYQVRRLLQAELIRLTGLHKRRVDTDEWQRVGSPEDGDGDAFNEAPAPRGCKLSTRVPAAAPKP